MDSNGKLTRRFSLRRLASSLTAIGAGIAGGRLMGQGSGSFSSVSKPYDCITSFVGTLPASQVILLVTFDRPVIFQGNFATSVGSCGVNPTATATFAVAKNGSGIGTVVVSTGGVVSFTSTSGAAQSFGIGDVMQVTGPASPDVTMANVAFTFSGRRVGA